MLHAAGENDPETQHPSSCCIMLQQPAVALLCCPLHLSMLAPVYVGVLLLLGSSLPPPLLLLLLLRTKGLNAEEQLVYQEIKASANKGEQQQQQQQPQACTGCV